MTRPLLWGILASLALAPAGATTLPDSTTEELVRRAETVCCVSCESVEARRDPRTGIVFTHVRLRTLEAMKGHPGAEVRLRLVGGRDGDVETRVDAMPRFREGGECVVLLGPPNRDGHPVVLLATRGVLHLGADEEGRRFLRTRVTGFDGLPEDARVGLDAFRGAVKRCLEEERRREAGIVGR